MLIIIVFFFLILLQTKDFEKNIEPIISTAYSCHSLTRLFRNTLNKTIKSEYSDKGNVNVGNDSIVQNGQLSQSNNNDAQSLNTFRESENLIFRCEENIFGCDKNSVEKSKHLNSLMSKSSENEQVPRVLKPVFTNGDSLTVNVKRQLSDDDMQVNDKKNKSTEICDLQFRKEDSFQTFEISSNNRNQLSFNVESTHHSVECPHTLTKGLKRTITICENDTSKKHCHTKSSYEKTHNKSQNQNVISDCQSPKLEIIDCDTSSNDNLSFEHSKRSQDINRVSHNMNEFSVRENKWVTKSSLSELSVGSPLNFKRKQSNFLSEGIENHILEINPYNNDQDCITSPSSDMQWSIKLSPCNQDDLDSPESKPIINSAEQLELETPSSDTEGNNSPKTENVLSLRNSEEIISKLVSSRLSKSSKNDNENTQMYALPVDQKVTHVEHSYVENVINSNTRDLEVVNVLSPASINSTDIPINKNSWVPDLSLINAQNDHNDVEDDYSHSTQQLNELCNAMSINTSCMSNHNNDVENHMQLETQISSRPCSYNQIEPKIYPAGSYIAALSSSESSISNSTYGSTYDVNRIPLTIPVKSIPKTLPIKDVMQELNDSSNGVYHGINQINKSFNGFKTKPAIEPQTSYNFAMRKIRPTDMSIIERLSPNHKDKIRIPDVVSDEFSDVDSLDLRINNVEPKETNTCINNLSMSSLISSDLKSMKILNNFDKSGDWSLKSPPDTSNHHQIQKLKIYTDPTEMIPGPINLNTQSPVPINLNEGRVQKIFLGNKSPSQVYYSPIADLCISSDIDMANHRNVEDLKQNHLKNNPSVRDHVNTTCSNDNYIHSVLQSVDNDQNTANQSLISGYENVIPSQNSPVVNNGFLYKFPRSDSNPSIIYENPVPVQNKNLDCLSPHNGLTYTNFDQVLGLNIEDKNQVDDQTIFNMAHIMLQSSKNCKVHYKWPLNKNKSQTTTSNEKIQETPQNLDIKKNSNVLYKFANSELNMSPVQNMSPNEISTQNSCLPCNERKNNSTPCHSNQQFQDISNLIASDLSPTLQSGSDSNEEKKVTQTQATTHFDGNLRKEPTDNLDTIYNNSKISNPNQEISTTLSCEVFEAARYLFNCGKLFLCMYPKCNNSHHFRVIPSNAEMLRHEFTVPFDDFRFNIQYKYKQLLTSNPRTWPNIPKLVQLYKRCLCEICSDFDSKLNQNQEMLHKYVEGKKPNIEEDNNENQQPTNPQLRLSWKKCLANRFSTEAIAKQSISQMIDDMQLHINRFTYAFTIIFSFSKDIKFNSQNLQNVCESCSDIIDSERLLTPDCLKQLEIAHKHFTKDIRHFSYQYLHTSKGAQKYVLEDLSNSSYQPPNQNLLSIPHQFDEEHLPNESNRYVIENSSSPLYRRVNSNLTSKSIKYVHENMPNTSHPPMVENSPSTSHQSSGSNLPNSPHQPILNSFPTTSHGIALESCSSLNDRAQKYNQMSRYYSDGQTFTESTHTYLQVPSVHFPTSSTNSYYGSPVNMPSDNSVPFCSPSLSLNSVPNSPSLSDCSIPSLVETVATAVPEHALLDDSLEAVNAAHNLMLISNRHRYNSTTSVTSTNTTDTITVMSSISNSSKTITYNNVFKTNTSNINTPSSNVTTNNTSTINDITDNITTVDIIINDVSKIDTKINAVQSSITEPEDQETDIVHNSRKKKKKKHDKKKDKKKKGKR